MKMQTSERQSQLLRWDEAMQLLNSVEDPITNQLMNRANFEILKRFFKLKDYPVSDFDLRFFMEIMLAFCSDHNNLREILSGENVGVFSDD